MKESNHNLFFCLVFILIFLIVPQFESQKKGEELTPYQAYLVELKEYRKNCRNA